MGERQVYQSSAEMKVNLVTDYLRNVAYSCGGNDLLHRVFPKVPADIMEQQLMNLAAMDLLEVVIPGSTDRLNTILGQFEETTNRNPELVRKLFGATQYPSQIDATAN